MNKLADAIVTAIAYISTAPADDDRAHDDVRALEALAALLSDCSPEERDALRSAVGRARVEAKSSSNIHPYLLDAYRAIETDIIDSDAD